MKVLELLDKYDGDFGLLSEPWASKKDRNLFSPDQLSTLAEYIEKQHFARVDSLSAELRDRTVTRITELESLIDDDVVDLLQKRLRLT